MLITWRRLGYRELIDPAANYIKFLTHFTRRDENNFVLCNKQKQYCQFHGSSNIDQATQSKQTEFRVMELFLWLHTVLIWFFSLNNSISHIELNCCKYQNYLTSKKIQMNFSDQDEERIEYVKNKPESVKADRQ